jgi:hypothetical protein
MRRAHEARGLGTLTQYTQHGDSDTVTSDPHCRSLGGAEKESFEDEVSMMDERVGRG